MLVDEERIDSFKCERFQPALHESDLVLVVKNLTAKKYITFSLSFVLKIPKNISSTLRRALRKSIVSPKYSPECTQNIFRDFEYKSIDNQTLQFHNAIHTMTVKVENGRSLQSDFRVRSKSSECQGANGSPNLLWIASENGGSNSTTVT